MALLTSPFSPSPPSPSPSQSRGVASPSGHSLREKRRTAPLSHGVDACLPCEGKQCSLTRACSQNTNKTCEECLKNVSCLWCNTNKACLDYPVTKVLPPASLCKLSSARWGVCWVNFEALIITMSVMGGTVLLGIAVCCCCCCCRRKRSRKPDKSDERAMREREERRVRQEERRAEMKSRHDEIRKKYGKSCVFCLVRSCRHTLWSWKCQAKVELGLGYSPFSVGFSIRAGRCLLRRAASWLCSSRFCPYWVLSLSWKRRPWKTSSQPDPSRGVFSPACACFVCVSELAE
uniref:PSI domain-containing protein n=1 Tax=Oryctolagus cuniculus TaxID=9986 RepID=A0A5F9CXX9_RABIT